jgi:hypothetical protein
VRVFHTRLPHPDKSVQVMPAPFPCGRSVRTGLPPFWAGALMPEVS